LPPILGFEEDNAGEGKSRKGNVSPRWDGLILVIRSNGLLLSFPLFYSFYIQDKGSASKGEVHIVARQVHNQNPLLFD
jgi:hypothetical protein